MTTIVEVVRENLPSQQAIGRRNAVPIIYTQGNHYEIGHDIGRTFGKVIRDFVDNYRPLNDTYLAQYETPEGQRVYEETLACVNEQYPQYVREIEGTAEGSGVPFYKLFLMHLDDIIVPPNAGNGCELQRNGTNPVGCSSIICNQPGQEILGHNEDALGETLNHWYLVDAHVIEPGLPEEKFCSLSYAGFLPGYTMGYNHHGLVYSVNTLSAKILRSGKTPRYFLARALLGADSSERAEEILRNEGYGAAEGFSVNMTFLNDYSGERIFKNVEIGPVEEDSSSSRLDITKAGPGEYIYHCNKYMRMKIPEVVGLIIDSSIHRMAAIDRHEQPKTVEDVVDILSDQTDDDFRVYQDIHPDDYVKTIATGIFDCIERTWSIYTDKPNCNKPIAVLPMRFKSPKIECYKQ